MSESPNYLMTEGGYKALCDEYDQLLKVDRPKIVETVSWAASNGDRSENADYHYGKKRLREIDKRLQYLEKRITNAKVMRMPDVKNQDRITFGATVSVAFETGEERSFKIVGEDEIYSAKQEDAQAMTLISYHSPLAKMLEGKRVDDELLFKRPKGDVYITVLQITYEDAA